MNTMPGTRGTIGGVMASGVTGRDCAVFFYRRNRRHVHDEGTVFVLVLTRTDLHRRYQRMESLLYHVLARLVAFSRGRIPLLALGGIAIIVIADALTTRVRVSQPVDALFDEPAHLATALLLLGFFSPSFRARFGMDGLLGLLVGSVLIDLDHLPQEFGHEFLTRGTDRPYPHSLLTLLIVLIIVVTLRAGMWRRIGWGFAFGLAAHFLRDLATNRVPLGWPITNHGFHLPYALYAATMLLALAMILWRTRVESRK